MPELSPVHAAILKAAKESSEWDPIRVAYDLTKTYAGTANARPESIPKLFQDLFALFGGITGQAKE